MGMSVWIVSLVLLLGGCRQAAKSLTVDEMVAEIVQHAMADDTAFFAKYLDAPYKGQAKQLIQQIQASGMADNYQSRLEITDAKARLNYHYLEKGCHFQIDLERHDGNWTIQRMWFCR